MKAIQKRILILLALMLTILVGCGGEDKTDTPPEEDLAVVPNAYFVGSESIVAVEPEAGMQLSELYTTETGAFVYTYVGFAAVNESVQSYVEKLTTEEHGFSIVNGETFRAAQAPDFTLAEGTVSLSKSAENEKITVIRLDWSADQCVASISIEDAPVIEEASSKPNTSNVGLSHSGAMEFLKELSPAVLQLEGESMEAYNIYIMNGFTYVNGEACLRIKIYTDSNSAQTNVHVGTYFMSGNGERIYRLSEDGLAIEMDQNQ